MTETINDLYMQLRRRFKDADIPMPALEARELTAAAAAVDKRQTANWGYIYLTEGTIARAEALARRRLAGEPLAYLLGEWDFYGLTFKVTPDVLIPRSDTERLCELAIARVQTGMEPRVLDLCCGSGCIGIALLKNVDDARVVSVDISEEALAVTRENAFRCGVSARHIALRADALAPPDERLGRFHLIVCNPPYITAEEMRGLDRGVRDYEPVLALYGGDDGLDFYRNIAAHWKDALLPGGALLFECGYRQYTQVAGVLEEYGWTDIDIQEDLSGVLRIVGATRPPGPEGHEPLE
ncbi:peptide chain release factor N(5)-glutamine methyltransferase [Intestinibacillus massiliensis]|uniref:peptide chain release factor N(5)-glutamine methyltransferase n=1 Tax=Intestinibacillus massiliensis TaxID=1871029 RepID=UPI000B351C05|nr:peptide chain release factor N(5)-glutamine methyltransferase [Intestinibacillus massiliensis]